MTAKLNKTQREARMDAYEGMIKGGHIKVIFAEQEDPKVLNTLHSLLQSAYREQLASAHKSNLRK